jgi:hypothetical protein
VPCIQLIGKKTTHVVREQLGNIDRTPGELLLKQTPHDTSPLLATGRRQSSYMAQVFLVAAQFIGNMLRECCRIPCF